MKNDLLDSLLHRLFEGELDAAAQEELNHQLEKSAAARVRYRRACAIHAALIQRASSYEDLPELGFVPERTTLTTAPAARRSMLAVIAGTVTALTLALFFPFFLRPSSLATVLESRDVTWEMESAIPRNGKLPSHALLAFARGSMRVGFPSGASVTLEGPCRFQISKPESLSVLHGRVSVHTPDGAEGFRIDTPGGRFVDLGTEFGLAVGSDGRAPVILTEVFKGEVEVRAESSSSERLVEGESRALVREANTPQLLKSLDENPVILSNHANRLPASSTEESAANLALGKPVFSPGFYAHLHGSVFPPEKLTDGRLNDTGVPGDWAFWLAPNEQGGEFTVDLLQTETVGRISLQNTNNRRIGDRGAAAFVAYGSLDNQTFTPLVSGRLPRIDAERDLVFPFHDFRFVPVKVRYLKVVVTEHYRHPKRPPTHIGHGGGLNEIRVFAE